MKCKNHPRYLVRRHPRGDCWKCWIMWWLRKWIVVEYIPVPKVKSAAPEA